MILILTATAIGFAMLAATFAFMWESDRWARSKLNDQFDKVARDNGQLNDGINTLTDALFEAKELLTKCEKAKLEALARVGKQCEALKANELAIAAMKVNERGMLALQTTSNEKIDELSAEITALRLRVDDEHKTNQQLKANLNRAVHDFENERARVKVIKEKVAAA